MRNLKTGRGFAVLSRFSVEHLPQEDARYVYARLCNYCGYPIVQNGVAEYLVDITDIGWEYSDWSRS